MFENLLEVLIDTMPYSIWLRDIDGRFIFANRQYCDSLNTDKESIVGKTVFDIYDEKLANEYTKNYEEVEILGKPKLFKGYQEDLLLECYIAPIIINNETVGFLGLLQDKTESKMYENEIIKQKNLLSTIIDTIPDSIFYKDINGTYLECNVAFAKDYYNTSKENIIGKKDTEVMKDTKIIKELISTDAKIIKNKEKEILHIKINDNEKTKYMESVKTPLLDKDDEVLGIVGISRDITSRILEERNLKKMTYIDKLTRVYNRSFFDKKIESINKESYLPLSLIMGDVDGLKIVNDTLGHLKGDELLTQIASVMKKVCRRDDLIVRWGGDEFVILLPNTDYECAETIWNRIKESCRDFEYTTIPLSISLGCATKNSEQENIDDILKQSEEKVYKEKLPKQSASKTYLLSSLQDTLKEKSLETQQHTNRLVHYAKKLGKSMNLSKSQMEELILSAQLHDIGKIGIPDEILSKPGTLTNSEMKIIKTHTEKGYRIAKSNYEISHVAKTILSHHEKWDGSGYPLGLKEEEIPFLARIICVLDSFDAMTSNRTYKTKMSKKDAFEELKRCSGSQFDPKIVEIFLEEFEYRNFS